MQNMAIFLTFVKGLENRLSVKNHDFGYKCRPIRLRKVWNQFMNETISFWTSVGWRQRPMLFTKFADSLSKIINKGYWLIIKRILNISSMVITYQGSLIQRCGLKCNFDENSSNEIWFVLQDLEVLTFVAKMLLFTFSNKTI